MRLRLGLAVIAVALPLGFSAAAADPVARYFYVTPAVGMTIYDSNYRYPNGSLLDRGYFGARGGWQYNGWLGLEAAGGSSATKENSQAATDGSFWHASGNVVFSPWAGLFGSPFLSVGAGLSKLTSDDPNAALTVRRSGDDSFTTPPGPVNQGNAEFAGGLNFWFTDRFALRLEARDVAWLSKDKVTDVLSNNIIATAGLTWAIGAKARDTDGDGVPDRKDTCPDTPKGATVDAKGCSHDSDGDGVLDGLDQCANTPKGATIDAKGCPHDSDGDGVWDGLDACPDTPKGATVDSVGCPHDSDGDGVLDGLDQCPSTPPGAKVDEKGCPIDSDGDGVPDGLDKCPETTPGLRVDSTGCPIDYMEREIELMDTGMIRIRNIQFETGKATLKSESFETLDTVGDLLSKWPELKIEIGGHTDSKGTKKVNDKLSQARADSVRAYLFVKFLLLKPEQYVTKGYGASRPIAPNTTDAGREQNRRVEFVVLNKGMLQKEIERRKQATKPAPADSTQGITVPAPQDTSKVTPKDK